MAKQNTSFAAMLYSADKMVTADEGQTKKILTWMCCFLDAESAWEEKRKHMIANARRRPTNQAIAEMVYESVEKCHVLDPRRSKY